MADFLYEKHAVTNAYPRCKDLSCWTPRDQKIWSAEQDLIPYHEQSNKTWQDMQLEELVGKIAQCAAARGSRW